MDTHPKYILTITRDGQVMHQTGASSDATMGGVILGAVLLGLAIGVAPGALIAHYGFGVTWGRSIAIGLGVMLGLGMIERALRPPQITVTPIPQPLSA